MDQPRNCLEIPEWINKAVRASQCPNGLALLIVANSSVGPKKLQHVTHDLSVLKDTFKKLNFTILSMNNPTMELLVEVTKCVNNLSNCGIAWPPSWKRLVVAYSGSDATIAFVKSKEKIITEIKIEGIKNALIDTRQEELLNIPKLFFLDCSRGTIFDSGIERVSTDAFSDTSHMVPRGGGRVPSGGNTLVAYSTRPGMMSCLAREGSGSYWIQMLSSSLIRDELIDHDIEGVLKEVNISLIERMSQDRFMQQPEYTSSLNEHVKLWKEAKEVLEPKQHQSMAQQLGQPQQLFMPQQLGQPQQQSIAQQFGPVAQQQYLLEQLTLSSQVNQSSQQYHVQQEQLRDLGVDEVQEFFLEPNQQEPQLHNSSDPCHQGYSNQPYLELPQQDPQPGLQPLYYGGSQQYALQQQSSHPQQPSYPDLNGQQNFMDVYYQGYTTQNPCNGASNFTDLHIRGAKDDGDEKQDPVANKSAHGGNSLPVKGPTKTPKTLLKEYCESKWKGKKEAKYTTREFNGGHKSTVLCPEIGYMDGDVKPTKKEAENNAASKVLRKLKLSTE